MQANPAELLEGKILQNGWTVGPRVQPKKAQTGGHFSVCYSCSNEDGVGAFLKAIDLQSVLNAPDFTTELQKITTEYNFERDLLIQCKSMNRIVSPLEFGEIKLENTSIPVSYIIFELAETTARSEISQGVIPLNKALKIMHNLAVATRQLHAKRIAHQDIKPSNALIFEGLGAKLGDLGRSITSDSPSPFEEYIWPGDITYAPPEIIYQQIHIDFDVRRLSTDLFLLASMLTSLTTSAPLSAWIKKHLDPNLHSQIWGGSYNSPYNTVLPYIEHAFADALQELGARLNTTYPNQNKQIEELLIIIGQLGHPDPIRRGRNQIPMTNTKARVRYSLESYISKFDRLSAKARIADARNRIR